MSDTSPLPLDPTDPRGRPVPPPPPSAARDARHLGASADVPRSAPPRHRRPPLVPTSDPFAAYGVRDEPPALPQPSPPEDPDALVGRPRRRIHRAGPDDPYRIGYDGTRGLVVVLALGVLVLLLVALWVGG